MKKAVLKSKKGRDIMGNIVGSFGLLTFVFSIIKSVLEVGFYVSVIVLAFKGVKALNIYLDKNSR